VSKKDLDIEALRFTVSSTQVSFILPPLEMLVRWLPGAATRASDPGTISTTPGPQGRERARASGSRRKNPRG
jgi:hypothetical protein